MFKTDQKKAQAKATSAGGQAATELAIFGAILIFLLGTIVRTAVSNSYMQNQNFKAMRMAMLASWQESKSHPGKGQRQVISHNSSQIIFLEDRLSPDYEKYGDMDRAPYIASGAGSFTYNLLYPISDSIDAINSLPIQDVWINGQHFPFTMASYNPDYPVTRVSLATCDSYKTAGNTCLADQCYRNYREWAGGLVRESSFITPAVAPYSLISGKCLTLYPQAGDLQRECEEQNTACTIFGLLTQAFSSSGAKTSPVVNLSSNASLSSDNCAMATGTVNTSAMDMTSLATIANSSPWPVFVSEYAGTFPGLTTTQYAGYLNAIINILQASNYQYKLFYTLQPNPGGQSSTSAGGAQFSMNAPSCPTHPCANDNELSQDVPLLGYDGSPILDASNNPVTNKDGYMQYDLRRMGYYFSSQSGASVPPCATAPYPKTCLPVSDPTQFPLTGCPNCLRNYVAWQWSAAAGTTAAMIGLNTSNNQYPTYDIDGRLKEVTIYKIWNAGGTTNIAFEDSEGGDIDASWDTNSCGPKPGLQTSQMQMFTFTNNGTYLEIKEGKLFNPETIGPGAGQVVRSANKRDTVDVIQRSIQLSNNTGRFCTPNSDHSFGGAVTNGTVQTYPCNPAVSADCANPNPVEVCVNENPCNCFMGGSANAPANANCNAYSVNNSGMTLAQTCYDTLQNVIYVRSRLQDLRGHFWMTNATGQLKVQ